MADTRVRSYARYLKYAPKRIALRLVGDGEVGTGRSFVSATNGVADLLVFGLLDGGFVGLHHTDISTSGCVRFRRHSLDLPRPFSVGQSLRLSRVRKWEGRRIVTILTFVERVYRKGMRTSANTSLVTTTRPGHSPSFFSPV